MPETGIETASFPFTMRMAVEPLRISSLIPSVDTIPAVVGPEEAHFDLRRLHVDAVERLESFHRAISLHGDRSFAFVDREVVVGDQRKVFPGPSFLIIEGDFLLSWHQSYE